MLHHSNDWKEVIQENFRNPGNFEMQILKQNIKLDSVATSVSGNHKFTYFKTKAPLNCWVETDHISSLEDYWWLLDGTYVAANDNSDDEHFLALNEADVESPFRQSALFKPKEDYCRFWCSFTNTSTILTEIDSKSDLLPLSIDDLFIIFDNARYTGPIDGYIRVWYLMDDGTVNYHDFNVPETWTYTLTKEQQLQEVPNAVKISGFYIRWTEWTDGMRPKLTTVALGGLIEPPEGWNITAVELTKEASYLCNSVPNFNLSISIDNTHKNIDPTLRTGVAADLKTGMLITTRWGQQYDSKGTELWLPWETWVISSIEIPADFNNVNIKCEPLAQYYKNDVITGYQHHGGSGFSLMELLVVFMARHIENFIDIHGSQYFWKSVKVPSRGMKFTTWTDGPDRSIGILNTLLYLSMVGTTTVSLDTISGLPKIVPILNYTKPEKLKDNCVIQLKNLDMQEPIESIVFKGVAQEYSDAGTENNASIYLSEDAVRRRQFWGNDIYNSDYFTVPSWQTLKFPYEYDLATGLDYVNSYFMAGWSVLRVDHGDFDYRDSSNVGAYIAVASKGTFQTVSNKFSTVNTTKFLITENTEFVENPCMGLFVEPPVQSPLKGDQTSFLDQAVRVSNILTTVTRNRYIVTFDYTGRPDLEPFDLIEVLIPELNETEPQEVVILSCSISYNGGYSGTIKGLVITTWN